jgi:hypothetical protein
VNRPEKVDSNEEASAVMAALKAENEKTSKLARNPPPSPDRSVRYSISVSIFVGFALRSLELYGHYS